MSFAASPRFRSSDRPNDMAISTIDPRRRQMSNALLANGNELGSREIDHRTRGARVRARGGGRIKAFGVENLTPLFTPFKKSRVLVFVQRHDPVATGI